MLVKHEQAISGSIGVRVNKNTKRLFLQLLRPAWLGQTLASLCWLASVFSYGLESRGDYLQLFAASFWLIANLAAISPSERD